MMTFMCRLTLFLLALFVAGAPAQAQTTPQGTAPNHVQVRLHSSVSQVGAGTPFTVVIEQLIEPGWHTYWKNPGDSGEPTQARWTLPDGGSAGALDFPIPERVPYGPLVNFGYTTRALFATTITPPTHFSGESYTVQVDLNWLVCKDICIPEGDRYTLILPIGTEAAVNADVGDIIRDLTMSHPVSVDWPAEFSDKNGTFALTFTPSEQAATLLRNKAHATLFPEDWGLFPNPAEQTVSLVPNTPNAFVISAPRDANDRALSDIHQSHILLVLTDTQGRHLGYLMNARNTDSPPPPQNQPIASTMPSAAAPASDATTDTGPTSATSAPFSLSAFMVALVLSLLGGVILNLMPCVFPVLSLKILSVAGSARDNPKDLRHHGFAYALGVLCMFALIAILIFALQTAGATVGWGFQLQQPIMVSLLINLFVLIGLNLMGWFDIDLNHLVPARLHGHREGLTGSFATGLLATVVATPCTAPFMGAAIGFALTQHPMVGMAVFLMLGVGLALPFVLVCTFPGLGRLLPKPGRWMVTLRQFLAFPMFLAAIWLVWVLAQQTGPGGVALALLGAFALAMLIWLWHHNAPKRPLVRAGRWGLMVLSLLLLIGTTATQQQIHKNVCAIEQEPGGLTKAYTPTVLKEALAGSDPVFVNMTAAWCITCKVNERMALATGATQKLFREKSILTLKGDWTNYNSDITAFLDQYGRKGVPLYVYYGPRDPESGLRPPPIVLPQILTEGIVRKIISGP